MGIWFQELNSYEPLCVQAIKFRSKEKGMGRGRIRDSLSTQAIPRQMWLPKSCHMDKTAGILSTGEFSRRQALLRLRLGAALRGKAVAMRQGRRQKMRSMGRERSPLSQTLSHTSLWLTVKNVNPADKSQKTAYRDKAFLQERCQTRILIKSHTCLRPELVQTPILTLSALSSYL